MRTTHLIALGTWGDVAPVLTLSQELGRRGHQVVVHGATRFERQAEAAGVPYHGALDVELFGGTPGRRRAVLAHSGITYLWLRDRYRRWSRAVWQDLRRRAHPDDVLVCGLGSAALARAWRRSGGRAALLLLADLLPRAGVLRQPRRQLVWRLAQGMSHTPTASSDVAGLPVIEAVSTTLSRPAAAAPQVTRTGHLIATAARDRCTGAPELPTDRPLVHLGLGSLGQASPALLDRLAAAAADVGCRLVIDAATLRPGPADGGQDAQGAHLADQLVTLPAGDHRVVFPQVSGVLHHGGAGTSVTGLLSARPTAVIPHLGDQFEIGRRIHALGAGPAPLHRHLLTPKALRRTLGVLADPPERYRRAARELSERLAAEDGVARTADAYDRVHDGAVTFD